MQVGRLSGRRLGYIPAVVDVASVRWLEFSWSNVLGERGERGDCLLLTLLRLLEPSDLMSLPFERFVDFMSYAIQIFVNLRYLYLNFVVEVVDVLLDFLLNVRFEVVVVFLDFFLDVCLQLFVIFLRLLGRHFLVFVQRSELEHHLLQHRLQT